MENDTFARKLEKDFSLPWHLQRVGEASEIITASGNPLFYIKCGKTEQDWNACKYLVHCANLMPEAVKVIRDLIGIAAVLDYGADNAVTRAKQLLAKLERGAEDERD